MACCICKAFGLKSYFEIKETLIYKYRSTEEEIGHIYLSCNCFFLQVNKGIVLIVIWVQFARFGNHEKTLITTVNPIYRTNNKIRLKVIAMLIRVIATFFRMIATFFRVIATLLRLSAVFKSLWGKV